MCPGMLKNHHEVSDKAEEKAEFHTNPAAKITSLSSINRTISAFHKVSALSSIFPLTEFPLQISVLCFLSSGHLPSETYYYAMRSAPCVCPPAHIKALRA